MIKPHGMVKAMLTEGCSKNNSQGDDDDNDSGHEEDAESEFNPRALKAMRDDITQLESQGLELREVMATMAARQE